MRVLQVHAPHREPGGEDAVVAAEAGLLRDHGHAVETLLVPNPTSAAGAVLALAQSPWNRRGARLVRDAVARHRPDVVHVHNTWFSLSASSVHAAASAGAPVVATLHSYRLACIDGTFFRDGAPCTACQTGRLWPGIRHACYRGSHVQSSVASAAQLVGRRAGVWPDDVTLFLAPTTLVRDLHLGAGIAADSIVVKPHFVADPGPRSSPPSASDTVVFVGRLAPGKGVETLLAAWRRTTGSGLRLEVLGDGPLRGELEHAAPPGVSFAGYVGADEVRKRLLGARALVFPSEWHEPFGLVIIEALAAGLPVVATSTGAAPDALVGEAQAWLVPPGDSDRLARAIDELAGDARVDAFGAWARGRWQEGYTPAVNLPLLEAAYERALARR